MEELLDIFKTTWQDKAFTRKEKQAIQKLINERDLDKRSKDRLRSQVFEFAMQQADNQNTRSVIAWLEVANKCLVQKHDDGEKEVHSRAFFSPGIDCKNAILNQLHSAVESLDVCVFTITDNSIAQAILEAKQKGVEVRILTDDDKSLDRGSDIEKLRSHDIPVKTDHSDAHMHHKFAIIDRKVLINGSFNWTVSATKRNQENLVISKERELIKQFVQEFERLWQMF